MAKLKIREVKPGEQIDGPWIFVLNPTQKHAWCVVAVHDDGKEEPASGLMDTEALAQHELSQLLLSCPDEFDLGDDVPF